MFRGSMSSGPVAQWIRHRPTEPGIVGSSPTRIKDARGASWIRRAAAVGREEVCRMGYIRWSHSSVGQSVRLITLRSAVQARVGPYVLSTAWQSVFSSPPRTRPGATRPDLRAQAQQRPAALGSARQAEKLSSDKPREAGAGRRRRGRAGGAPGGGGGG